MAASATAEKWLQRAALTVLHRCLSSLRSCLAICGVATSSPRWPRIPSGFTCHETDIAQWQKTSIPKAGVCLQFWTISNNLSSDIAFRHSLHSLLWNSYPAKPGPWHRSATSTASSTSAPSACRPRGAEPRAQHSHPARLHPLTRGLFPQPHHFLPRFLIYIFLFSDL